MIVVGLAAPTIACIPSTHCPFPPVDARPRALAVHVANVVLRLAASVYTPANPGSDPGEALRTAGEADRALHATRAFSAGQHLTGGQYPPHPGEDDKVSSMSRYRLHPRGGFVKAWHAAAVALVVVACGASASAAGAWHSTGRVNIVRQGQAPAKAPANTHYYKTIQAAVNASTSGDWVLIEPGVYYEAVKVTSAQSGIWIRGMNRNKVIIDGQHKAGNGIEIYKASNVWVENLTARNFDTGCENCGNEIWWNGGAGSNKIGAHGWFGSYLTAYDDGLNGGYGIFTDNETEGSWDHVYASGFNDSGIYLGACQECNARITTATLENNALGYSGSNSGGRLAIEYSLVRHNALGIAPNSENPGDGPPPQDGECNRPNIENPNPTPSIGSTNIPRCTVIRNNVITENNNLTTPVNGSTAPAPWGVGVALPGDYADLIEQNLIVNNANNGVLGFEYPNPFPPGGTTIFFQLAGNRIGKNLFVHNGYRGGAFTGDVTLAGGFFPFSESTNNCVSGNLFTSATFPAKIQGTWGCQNATTPNPGGGEAAIGYLVTLPTEAAEARAKTPPVGQPVPPAQPSMPNACEGVPRNPLCP